MGEFAKVAAQATGDWEARLQGQQDRLNAVIPSTQQETTLKALAKLKAMRQGAFSTGYALRGQTRTDPMADLLNELKTDSIPTREHAITLPGLKRAALSDKDQAWAASAEPDRHFGATAALGVGGALAGAHHAKHPLGALYGGAAGALPGMLIDELRDRARNKRYTRILSNTKEPAEKKALLGPILNPIKHGFQDLKAEAAHALDKQFASATRVTDDPATLPWYYPSMAMHTPKAFAEGYQEADKDHAKATNVGLDKQIAAAREQFNRALQEEYRGRNKAASAGELIDALATKAAAGELNAVGGAYGALAGLLGTGSYHQAKAWTEDHDPRVMKAKALRELIRTRMRNSPPVVRVEAPEQSLVETPQ